jgi:hypothetical protein
VPGHRTHNTVIWFTRLPGGLLVEIRAELETDPARFAATYRYERGTIVGVRDMEFEQMPLVFHGARNTVTSPTLPRPDWWSYASGTPGVVGGIYFVWHRDAVQRPVDAFGPVRPDLLPKEDGA